MNSADSRPLRAFAGEHRPRRSILVCNERLPRISDGVEVLPWREFLGMLWAGEIIS